ncbi:MAG: RIP metalloprotease RseP [Terracidiphilus sp.]
MHQFLVSAGAFIVLIGLMVVVHEFGHFAIAKLVGVRVEAFSIGFGPRLFGYKYGDTDYKVCLLPLGGYVKMAGENFAEVSDAARGEATVAPADDSGSFLSHPRWQRILIGLAGPVANFILAFVLMLFYFGVINEVPSIHPIVVEWVAAASPAAEAGLVPHDVILQFGKAQNPTWNQIDTIASHSDGQTVPVTVERDGKTLSLQLRMAAHAGGKTAAQESAIEQDGLYLRLWQSPIRVDSVEADSPSQQAGLRAGDQIVAVDGHAFHTLDPLVSYLQTGRGRPITLSVRRDGRMLAPLVVHPSMQDGVWRLGFGYLPPTNLPTHWEPMPLAQAAAGAKDFCVANSTLIVDVLGRILTHKTPVSQLAGPVGIAQMAGEAAEMKDWSPKFGLAAVISLNLGILNLLPFPILDGGLIFLLLIEGAMRHDISINIKERIYQAAFVVLLGFFAFVIFNDMTRLPLFTHLRP